MVAEETILGVLRTILDPEMPITIVDLGIVEAIRIEESEAAADIELDILPTFVGCPALGVIEREITEKLLALDGVASVKVNFIFDPAWSVDRISDAGRASLRAIGVGVPQPHAAPELVQVSLPIPCPFCESTRTHQTSPFGPTRCRMIYYCDSCGNSFEYMKRIQGGTVEPTRGPSPRD